MSERRMFAKSITESDAFLDLPLSAQALYFHLSMNADDEGFINSVKRIQRICGASDEDFRQLTNRAFVITFESGICVIKHWKINNRIRKDRECKTNYPEEKRLLIEKENGVYSLQTAEKAIKTETFAEHYGCLPAEKPTTEDYEPEEKEPVKEEPEREEEPPEEKDIELEAMGEPRKDYAESVFDIIFAANLPCRANNFITFSMGDFEQGLSEIAGLKLSPDEVIAALKNYVEVIKLKRAGLTWWTAEQDFYSFCKNKTIIKFLPGNFKIDNFTKDGENRQPLEDKIQL